MANAKTHDLRARIDKSWIHLKGQLQGMETHMEATEAPGEWTTRQVLAHLLFEPGWKPVPLLKSFAAKDLPGVEIDPGLTDVTGGRETMTLKQFVDALDTQRREVSTYLDGLSEADLKRKARIPLFKEIMGIDEIDIPTFVGALFEFHWNDHAGQIAKIRKAAGLPPVK
jgi:hypothetical protein